MSSITEKTLKLRVIHFEEEKQLHAQLLENAEQKAADYYNWFLDQLEVNAKLRQQIETLEKSNPKNK